MWLATTLSRGHGNGVGLVDVELLLRVLGGGSRVLQRPRPLAARSLWVLPAPIFSPVKCGEESPGLQAP